MIKIIVTKILDNFEYNIWQNSLETINWFNNIKNKKSTIFIQFDIIDFYPSISKELQINSINFAKNYITITKHELDIILARRRPILVSDNDTWIKNHMYNFNVTIESFDLAQIADLVRIYILNTNAWILNLSQISLYRDDGLIYIPNSNDYKIKIF